MSSTVLGFTVRDLSKHGKQEMCNVSVNVGKALPATTTGNLFSVSGVVLVSGLIGVVSTVFSATAVHITLGVTGSSAAISAAPSSAYASTAVGSVVQLPTALGGALPAAVSASATALSASMFVVDAADITITTDATNTGAITWMLFWEPLYPKQNAAVAAV